MLQKTFITQMKLRGLQLLRDRTLAFKDEKYYGRKKLKQKLTVLCTSKTCTQIPISRYQSFIEVKIFLNVKSLPAEYKGKEISWMNSKFFFLNGYKS